MGVRREEKRREEGRNMVFDKLLSEVLG